MNAKGKPCIPPPVSARIVASTDALLSAQHFADRLDIHISTFRRAVKAGRIPAPINVTPRCQRWPMSDLRLLLEGKGGR
jgi:predicted DNA-binding transcriptional regulator AlpA